MCSCGNERITAIRRSDAKKFGNNFDRASLTLNTWTVGGLQVVNRVWRHGLGLLLGLCMIGLAPVADAHHANSMIDMQKRYVMRGTVAKLLWTNPHGWLYVDVNKQSGKPELWGFEFGSPNAMMRAGWNPRDIEVGDKVTVLASVARNGKHIGALIKLTLPDGRELEGIPVPEGQDIPTAGLQSGANIPTSEYK